VRQVIRYAVNLALAGAAVMVTVVLFELGARQFIPAWTPKHGVRNFWVHHYLLGWAHNPDSSGTHKHRDFRVEVATNSRGFRDREYPVARVPGKKRMLFLGDSFGFGFGVEQDQIMTEVMERKYPGWEVINTAVAGYGTDQQLLFMQEGGLRYRPDVVLVLYHPNDVEDNNAGKRYGYPKPQFVLDNGSLELTNVPVPELGGRAKLDRYLYQRTYFLHKVYNARKLLRRSLEQMAQPEAQEGKRNRNSDFTLTKKLFVALDELIEASGARLVVVSVPGRPDPREPLSEVLGPLGVPYLPLDRAFAGRTRQTYKFEHDPHWNAEGQRIAAEATEAFLLDLGVFP
jgi:hypothetical protein